MAPFNCNYKFPSGGFSRVCSEAQRLIFTVSNTSRFLCDFKTRRFHTWMFVRKQRCIHSAVKATPILAYVVID